MFFPDRLENGPILSSRFATLVGCVGVLMPALLCGPWINMPSRGVTVLLAGMLAVYACFTPRLDQWLTNNPWHRRGMCLIWSAVVATLVFGSNLSARWWIVDDHDICAALGTKRSMSLRDWACQLREHPEFGSPSKMGRRYRPAYYFLRFTECLLWGNNPRAWYVAHLTMLAISLALAWSVLWQRLGSLNTSLLLLVLLTYPFWADIWCRLGPAEAYAVLGSSLYLAGIASVYSDVHQERSVNSVIPWVWITLGGLIAIGSKENFLLLLPATWLFGAWLWQSGTLNRAGLSCIGLLTIVGLLVAAMVCRGLHQSMSDIYGQDVRPNHRIQLIPLAVDQFWRTGIGRALCTGIGCIAVFVGLTLYYGVYERIGRPLRQGMLLIVTLFFLYFSQFIFYNGLWPTEMRYDFPGVLALPLMAITLVWMLLGFLSQLQLPGQSLVRCLTVGTMSIIVLQHGFARNQLAARENAARTISFTTNLERMIGELNADTCRPVVLIGHRPNDYELVDSVLRYFFAHRVANPIFLQLKFTSKDAGSCLEKELVISLNRTSVEGRDSTPIACGVCPIRQLSSIESAFVIGISGEADRTGHYLGSLGCF